MKGKAFQSRFNHWRGDGHLRKVFRNFGLLLSGRGVAGVLALGSMALMGHGLTPQEFGTVVLIHTLAMAAKGLIQIQPWAAVIHYGVSALQHDDQARFKRLISYTVGVDLASAAAAATVAIALASMAAGHFGWDEQTLHLAQLYGTVLLVAVEATPKGILRLFNRYDLLSLQSIIRPLLRIMGIGLAYLMEGGIASYLAAWYLGNFSHYLTLVLVARTEMRRHVDGRLLIGIHPQQVRSECPRLWSYMIAVYWQNLLDQVQKNLATLLTGALFGSAAAGLYKVAWDMANVLSKPVLMLRQSILPDLARLWQSRDRAFLRLTLRSGFLAGSASALIFMIVIIAGDSLIGLVMGRAYVEASSLLTLLVLAGTLDLYGFALGPAGYAMGKPGVIVKINSVATVVYIVLFVGLSSHFGLLAPGLAATATALVSMVSLTIAIVRLSRMPAQPVQS